MELRTIGIQKLRKLVRIFEKFAPPEEWLSGSQQTKEYYIYWLEKMYHRYKKHEKYTIIRQIGRRGKDGETFLVLDEQGREWAMKTFQLRKSKKQIEMEIQLQTVAAEAGVAPRVIDYSVDGRYIVMEKLDQTLFDYLLETKGELPKAIGTKFKQLFQKLDEGKVFHGDPNPLNFMRKKNRWYLVDYGMSQRVQGDFARQFGTNPNQILMKQGLETHLEKCFSRKYTI